MPVILPEEHHDAWLSGETGKEILSHSANRMKAWPIDARMNLPDNNDPEIIVPIEQHEKISQVDNGEFSFD
jgi:putative SOS response-associated peptidase YedK